MGTIVSFLVVGGLILWVLVDIHQNAKEERAKKARIQAREDKLEARADAEYEYQQALRLAELRLLEQQRINEAIASPDDLDAILAGDVKASKQHGARRRAVERMPRWA
ncbi:Hypothetical protein PFR_JS12-1_1930 [Propionibacterium freudenreichii]|nr:Hypothetical protein PFR_JS12-2_1929 [Propionibacterium freudenreichii]SCC97898.1 Hypothetical protein PFR_JS12-1_1930 [Propionibacterium freudenreichii]